MVWWHAAFFTLTLLIFCLNKNKPLLMIMNSKRSFILGWIRSRTPHTMKYHYILLVYWVPTKTGKFTYKACLFTWSKPALISYILIKSQSLFLGCNGDAENVSFMSMCFAWWLEKLTYMACLFTFWSWMFWTKQVGKYIHINVLSALTSAVTLN